MLKYFLAVARHQNITRAAEELHLTQPTLSRQLQELEEELGTPLFTREKRRMELTQAGLFLKARAEEMTTLEAKTLDQFAHMEDFVAGDVYLGCGDVQRGVYHYEDKEILASFAFDVRSGNGAGCRRSGNGC